MRKQTLWLTAIVLTLFPGTACADAGTPLVWAGALHLALGNLFIGIAEGAILVWLCRPKRAGSIPIMIAANYFSAWVGGLGLLPKITAHLNLDLYNAWRWLWCMVVVSYLLTLLLEWPFVALSLRQSEGWFRKSLWGSLVVQSASYLVLFGWYWAASGTSLYTDLAVVPPSAISLPQGVTLYYVADNDTAVYAQDLDHFKTVKIGEVNPSGNWDRLFLLESSAIAGRWDLVVGLDTPSRPGHPTPSDSIVSAGLTCAVAEPPTVGFRPGGDVSRFPADKSGWEFHYGWMMGHLVGDNAKKGRKVDVSLDTPFVRWYIDYPTQLPSGQVVFQLGRDQICVLDPNQRKVALFARGRWPVITMGAGTSR